MLWIVAHILLWLALAAGTFVIIDLIINGGGGPPYAGA